MACKQAMLVTSVLAAHWLTAGVVGAVEEGADSETSCWSCFRGNPAMTGVAEFVLAPPLERVWSFQPPDKQIGCKASAVIRAGQIFLGDDAGVFRALSLEDGSERWRFETDAAVEGSACFTTAGLVVFGSGDGYVYALDQITGAERWRFETGGEVHGGMNIYRKDGSDEELVIFGSYDNFCYALNAGTGKKAWEFETGNYINGAVAIADGRVLFGGCDGFLYVLAADSGKSLGPIEIGSYVASTVGVDEGVVYTGHYGNRVVALRVEDGEQVWEYGDREFPYFSSPRGAG